MRRLLIGAAALALAASGAAYAQGKGNGGGHGNGGGGGGDHGPAMQQAKGHGGGGDDHGPPAMRGNGGEKARGPEMRPQMRSPVERPQAQRGPDKAHGNPHAMADRGPPAGRGPEAEHGKPADRIPVDVRGPAPRDIRGGDDGVRPFRWSQAPRTPLVNGCPPGLAKKNNGCMPPGLARQDNRYAAWQPYYQRPDWWGIQGLSDGRYDYRDGYLVRYSGNSIASYVPLLGGALAVGAPWPSSYQPVVLPDYYDSYYGLGPSYRYADDVLYRVDPQTSAIDSIAALLTGDDLAVGSPLPDYYDVYNVPYPYRDRYVDGSDALYRYSDGYIYQVDPTTRLVQAVIQLLT